MGVVTQTRTRADTRPQDYTAAMDAIRKKMQSLKAETDGLYATIQKFEDATKEYNRQADQADCDIRDYGKKVQNLEIAFDETNDKLTKATESLEEKEKMYQAVEAAVSALTRRIMLMEEEAKKSEQTLADTVTRLANKSKEADSVLKKAKLAENKLKSIEEELQIVGENMKQLEKSAEKAVEREEKLKDKILQIQQKYKVAEGRFEYGEMNITKLNQRIDDIEDEIYREKLKIKKCADDLSDTFDDMLAHY